MKFDFKTFTREKWTTVIFLLIIFTILIGMFRHASAIGEEFLTTYRTTVLPGTPIMERVNGAIDAVESSVNAGMPQRQKFIELFGLAQLVMDKKILSDPNYGALYRTPYDQITYAVGEKYLLGHLNNTFELANMLLTNHIQFLYVQAPFKLPDAHSQVPLTVTDYSNQNADKFLEGLSAAKVPYMDLRPTFWNSGMTQNELFFNTDHHWTIDGAFLGTSELIKELNAQYGFHIDEKYYNIDNFNRKTYKDFYIGSMGRRVGEIYGGIDDFTLITPKFDTNYTLYQDGSKFSEGSFEDAILSKEYIDENAPLDTNRYAVYHGDNAELIFQNHLVKDGKVLIIKDSFGLPVYSFLSLGVHEVRAIDVRLFKEDVAEYAIKYKPDIVVLLYNADCFSDQMFNFKKK